MAKMVENKESIIPDHIYDNKSDKFYAKKSFLGKGGFGVVYQFEDIRTRTVFAGKAVSKSSMTNSYESARIIQEIEIHKTLSHRNIVQFHGSFQDNYNYYIVLELCSNRSMLNMLIRRRTVTEFETRYYMKQILDGVDYLHSKQIIHRDLKLLNLLLNENMQVKIADFGFSTKQVEDKLNLTVCGTLNYTAPEIMTRIGHSYEVDIWSMGCIMYTLLVGQHPFQSSTDKKTQIKILTCDYKIPSNLSIVPRQLITTMLQPKPLMRLSVALLKKDPFFTFGIIPSNLPTSCLTMAPSHEMIEELCRRTCQQISDINNNNLVSIQNVEMDIENGLRTLKEQLSSLSSVLKHNTAKEMSSFDEKTEKVFYANVWVNKWMKKQKKITIGEFAYQLSNDTIGMFCKDHTHLIMLANQHNIHYIEQSGRQHYYSIEDYPSNISNKMEYMVKCAAYMKDLKKASEPVPRRENNTFSRPTYLYYYQFTQELIVLLLTDSSLQINFKDHTKIILCPSIAAVTYIDQTEKFRTFKFETIAKYGCCAELAKCLSYARYKVNELLTSKAFKHVI